MATFTRPGRDEFPPYYHNYLDLVPQNVADITQHLKQQGLAMMTLLRTLTDAQSEYRYEPDKWSIKEVVGHLIDTERLMAFRALWIARGNGGNQPGIDQDLWGRNSNAHQRRIAELWREQHVCRTDHVYLFRSLDQEVVQRRGLADGNEVSVRTFPWIIAGHERHHLNVLLQRYDLKKD